MDLAQDVTDDEGNLEAITWKTITVRLGDLKPWAENPKTITKAAAKRLLTSWKDYGQVQTIAVSPSLVVLDGHQRLNVLLTAYGADYRVDARQASRELTEDEQKRLVVLLHAGAVGSWDWDSLSGWSASDLMEWGMDSDALAGWKRDVSALGNLLESEKPTADARQTLAERFIVPPFSVLDARQGYWMERKTAWYKLGVDRGDTREGALGYQSISSETPGDPYDLGGGLKTVSVIDPVLCELAYRWFCPPGGLVINPTAGESTYGIVAAYLGYRYKGVELRTEQVDINRKQAEACGVSPEWITGDGQDVYDLVGEDADFIMCCPPYADLEVYSDDPRDLSTMEYKDFLNIYRRIISESVRRLKNNRFACFTVGDIRDKSGSYRNFVSETITCFVESGCFLYNEAVLITPYGSLSRRAGRPFISSRKLGKTHQNVLIFVKGDWREAVKACGDVEVYFPDVSKDI